MGGKWRSADVRAEGEGIVCVEPRVARPECGVGRLVKGVGVGIRAVSLYRGVSRSEPSGYAREPSLKKL